MLQHICGFEVPAEDPTLARFHAWSTALFARPSIQKTALFDAHSELILAVRACGCGTPAQSAQMNDMFVDNEALADQLHIPRFPTATPTAVMTVGPGPG